MQGELTGAVKTRKKPEPKVKVEIVVEHGVVVAVNSNTDILYKIKDEDNVGGGTPREQSENTYEPDYVGDLGW